MIMLTTVKNTVYKAFGLTIASDFELPELPHANDKENIPNIVIIKADLTLLWSELMEPGRYFVVKENLIMFQVPGVAIYLIKNGNEIIVSPFDHSEMAQIRLYILGTCMGAALLQRRILPLHGSAVAIKDKAYAFVGDSGAGKSTLATAFLKKDFQLISDDVIPVALSDNNTPVVTPAFPQQKLWLDSLEKFGMESSHLRPIINRETKFSVPVRTQFATKKMPLAGIFELIKTDNDEIEVYALQNLKQLHTLFRHTYRNLFIDRSSLSEWHFNTSVKMVSQIEFYQLHRPFSRFTAFDLVDIILTKIDKREKVR